MEKYIGNKRRIVKHIGDLIDSLGIKEGIVLDIFAGTNNVGKFFKQRNFSVIANDFNACSFVFAKAYIEGRGVPRFKALEKRYGIHALVEEHTLQHFFKLNGNGHKYEKRDFRDTEHTFVELLAALSSVQLLNQLIKFEEKLNVYPLIFQNYAPGGRKSKYVDRDGLSKNRMFFTDQHSKHIDLLLNLLRFWKENLLVSEREFYVLLSGVVHAATLFSNTSGVYEAFYKEWFPNTRQTFRLPIPDMASLRFGLSGKAYRQDANRLVAALKKPIDILYVDPPYNTRQYGSNYHLLNTIADFHNIRDFKDFESKLVGVRGQHREANLRSRFSSRKYFRPAMEELVFLARAKYVIISYFDGDDNLWNQDGNREGINVLSSILKDERHFKPETFKLVKIPRKNFQSRNGLQKKMVNELLFCAEKV